MEYRTVEEIMVPIDKYPQVRDTMTLRDAIEVLEGFQIQNADGKMSSPRILLVLNEAGQFVGVLRRRDILRGLEPGFMVRSKVPHQRTAFEVVVDSNLSELSYDKITQQMIHHAGRSVRSYMVPIRETLNHDDHLVKAINQIVDSDRSVIPVLKDGRVIGILRTLDVMHEIRKYLENSD